MRFHVISLPHTQTNEKYLCCAFTQKVVKFCRMMFHRGHEVFLYSGEDNSTVCTEHISIVSKQEQMEWFGDHGYCQRGDVLPPLDFDANRIHWLSMNGSAVKEINKRKQNGDIICLISNSQRMISDLIPGFLAVEYGVGYEGVHTCNRAFESNSWRHHVYGLMKERDGNPSDTVIPNYFDTSEFFGSDGQLPPKGDYYLFIGRMVRRKGIEMAVATTEEMGEKLILCGQGIIREVESNGCKGLIANELVVVGKNIEYAGMAGVRERARLMASAKAVFVPTIYIEPFGGVHAEAMICGTPVICTNWGAFSDTIEHGVTGFLCDTKEDFINAARQSPLLDRELIRKKAVSRFSLEAVAPLYEKWFARLLAARQPA